MLNGLKSKYNLDPILARAVANIVGPAFGWLTSNHISGHYFLHYFPIPSNTPFFFCLTSTSFIEGVVKSKNLFSKS